MALFFFIQFRGNYKKISSYQHLEYDKDEIKNKDNLINKIKNKQDLFGRNYKYKNINLDKRTAPEYIIENIDSFHEWIDR